MIQTSKQKIWILFTIICMDLLTGMEFDLFVPSFSELQTQFHLTPFWVEALLSVNFIGYCVSLFVVGSLADKYGRKPIILMGLSIFVIGSLFCASTYSYYFLFLGRFLQGAGIAAPAILSFLIIADAYPLKEQQFLMAILNGSMNIAVGIAPIIGSYLTLYFHWRGNFIALLILGLFVMGMTLSLVSNSIGHSQPTLEKKSYLPILKSKPLLLLINCILFVFVPYWIFVGMSPLLYLQDMAVTLEQFGYYQGILAIVFAFSSIGFGLIIKHAGIKQQKILWAALIILIISLLILLFPVLLNSRDPFIITATFVPFIIAQVIPSNILYPLCINFFPQFKGRVSALIQGGRLVLSAVGVQIAGYFYSGTYQSIGIVLTIFIIIACLLFVAVINNQKIMAKLE